jgi:hypothetical protein
VQDYGGDMARMCSRQGCVRTASSTLSYQYARSTVWLDDLTPEREPHLYDLCDRHADRLTVPTGWILEDRRRRFLAWDTDRAVG